MDSQLIAFDIAADIAIAAGWAVILFVAKDIFVDRKNEL
jgi:hypothetical protein